MNILITILVILVVFVYITIYRKYSKTFTIIQSSIRTVTPSHLLEKQPIVITEPLVRPLDILHTLFKYMYVTKRQLLEITPGEFKRVKSKYMILFPNKRSEKHNTVHIVHPKYSHLLKDDKRLHEAQYVDIKLKKYQVLILPQHWWFSINNCNVTCFELYDILTFIESFTL